MGKVLVPKKNTRKKNPLKKKASTVTKKRGVAKKSKKPGKRVSAIPTDYHSITPYLIVSDADRAITFYQDAFGATLSMCMPKEDGKVGHAELTIGDSKLMLADEYPEFNILSASSIGASPVSIHFYTDNVDDVVGRAVSFGATLFRPIEDMFYGDRSGAIIDPFGHRWFISTHIEDVSPDEIQKRAKKLRREHT